MNDALLLDEVEQWLETHGTIKGTPFSEHGLLERLREMRPKKTPERANGMDVIPEMTDPRGKHWTQPDRQMIFIRGGVAHMTKQDFSKLSQYDTSMPSGVYPGKMWKRLEKDKFYLVWYEDKPESNGKLCNIKYLPIQVD